MMDQRSGNADDARYWAAAAEGQLVFQKCSECGHVQFPPRHQCATCWSDLLDVVVSSGKGTIESLTVVRRAPLPAFRALVPYVIAAIRTDEGPRMITNLVGDDAIEARIGEDVHVTFEAGIDKVLPQFRRVAA